MYIEVLMEIKNKHVDKTFTYQVPSLLQSKVQIGMRVLAPFGNQILEGYILNILESVSCEVKEILDVLDEEPVLNSEMLELGVFLKNQTFSSLSSCYATMLPKALKAKEKSHVSKKMSSFLKLNIPYSEALLLCKNEIQRQILTLFFDNDKVSKKSVSSISVSALKTLIKNQVLVEFQEEVYRYQLKETSVFEKKVLNEEQQNAFLEIKKGFGKEGVFLLHGVTGSGKTEVYLELIEEVLKQNKTALVLVPEISLTPQFIHRFQKRFSSSIAVLHSGLSDGERYDEWRKIIREEANIVIGVRSAIFAPLKNIGIIILDEEHSESYKQENNPKYHVFDIAKYRSNWHHSPIVLGSATPSLGSMARASKKVYQYIPLKKRANQSELPICQIVDMQEEVKYRHPILSRELECKIIEKLNKKEQILLLLNRRGHSTTITCSNCGFTHRCIHCDITLTYHKSSNQLRCHYCGYTKFLEDCCPNCKEKSLNYFGLGTEKLEEYLQDIFPTARILRMDRDTTANKGMYEKIISSFSNGEYDILLGTQMISKGLDFSNVSLVGILSADTTLNIPDYRSNERTFSLLYQASGRAGRGKTTGEVILQTFYPNHIVFQCIKENNFMKFYQYEMNTRKTLKYPPFYYLVVITIKSKDYKMCSLEAKKVKDFLEKRLDSSSIVLGPSTANLFFVNNVYHFEILVKYRFDSKIMETLKELDEIYLLQSKVYLDIDFQN